MDVDKITLYEEYRLIERTEMEVNGVWKGAHLLLFFLAFVFGSFCTFCFHMLMYLFDEKCVLFPKLMSLTNIRQNIIYEFIPEDKETADMMPVDFVSTQWVEKSACLLPTYVPLVSGIFGLVWTTMFLMYSIGSRVLTGLQRPWRVLPPVFLFSLIMGCLCLYTSTVTHYGLQEMCLKLSEITGSSSCTYTVNVATLAYQRRIRGVYQATRLTIVSAWLHTACWLLSALLALARVLLVVDFKLVRVAVQLQGNIDRMLEHHERHICTVSADSLEKSSVPAKRSRGSIRIHFLKKQLRPHLVDENESGDLLYYSDLPEQPSDSSLVPVERHKLDRLAACSAVPKEHQFIVKMLYNILDNLDASQSPELISSSTTSESLATITSPPISRQYGQQKISSALSLKRSGQTQDMTFVDLEEAEEIALEVKRQLQSILNRKLSDLKEMNYRPARNVGFESSLSIASDMRVALEAKKTEDEHLSPDYDGPSTSKGRGKKLKSSLKSTGMQTDEERKDKSQKVHIDSRTDIIYSSKTSIEKAEALKDTKETQTKKEKQD